MNSVRIVADSGCDITPALAAANDITIVPLIVRFGQEAVWDVEMTPDDFWRRQIASGQLPGTASPPPGEFAGAYQKLVEAGHDVLCLTLPGNHSSVFNTAWLAAQEFGDRVRVIDSGSISLGIGLQALSAALQARSGLPLDAIYQHVDEMRRRTSVIFTLETVEWARRGGRIARVLPLIDRVARTFHVKPVLELINGDMRLLGVSRSWRGALQRIEDEVRSRLPAEALGTAYTRCQEAAADMTARLEQMVGLPPEQVPCVEAGPVFSAHTGPNALGAVIIRAR